MKSYLKRHFLLDLVAMEIGVEHHDGVGEHVHRVLIGKLLTKVIAVGLLHAITKKKPQQF